MLNEAQRAAVQAPMQCHVRVLAGAGSGKTRVLVHRLAWLIQSGGVSPWSLLAVTFTNKAASEMRERVESMLGYEAGGMWLGTFHGLAHRFLRRHWEASGLDRRFQILDSEDQLRMVRRTLAALSMDEKKWAPRSVQGFINGEKDEGRRPDHIDPAGDVVRARLVDAYRDYQQRCDASASVDFAELLLRAHETLRETPDLLAHYQERFRFLLVDEFQDTNAIQYAWLRLLAGKEGRLFAVGDDDQSIYGWRGARIENILRMEREFPGVETFRLEQNYRSSGQILQAANALITNNGDRLGKDLWTSEPDGDPLELYTAFNERDEARFVVEKILAWVSDGGLRSAVAVLYRSNAQSRVFEEALVAQQVPYRVYGGLRFFERAEIKDALAYLRLVSTRSDDASFERIVNTPPRGIGAKTVEVLRQVSRENDESMWDAAVRAVKGRAFAPRAEKALGAFLNLLDVLTAQVRAGGDLGGAVEAVHQRTGLLDYHARDSARGEERVENLKELVTAARGAEGLLSVDDADDMLAAFLAHAALEAGEDGDDAEKDCVQLMTLHSAKGLEFPMVFIVGLEEGLLPTSRSLEDPVRVEEERRLCYVGITRAQSRLCLSHAERRRIYGQEMLAKKSRFLREIPGNLLTDLRPRAHVSRPFTTRTTAIGASAEEGAVFPPGARVGHPRFGEGVVMRYEGGGAHLRVHVNFRDHGSKCLVLTYAKLESLE